MKKKSNYIVIEITIAIFVLSILTWIFIPKFLASQNINTPENFPDPVVRAAVEKFMEVEPGGYFNQRMAAEKKGELVLTPRTYRSRLYEGEYKYITLVDNIELPTVTDITGLHHFTSINFIRFVANPRFDHLNFTKLPKVMSLSITGSSIKSVSFANCPDISSVALLKGKLNDIDVSHNKYLRNLSVNHNQLKNIDISNNEKLVYLDCSYNQIVELDLTNQKEINIISCINNQISAMDFSNNSVLITLDIAHNPIVTIDLSQQLHLKKLILDIDQLLYSEITVHPSAEPEILLRDVDGSYLFLQQMGVDEQQIIQQRMDDLLKGTSTPSQNPN